MVEIAPPKDSDGHYLVPEKDPFGPADPVWTYGDRSNFHLFIISGAHRLPNGHTIICSAVQGRFFEVTPEGEVVWEYWTFFSGNVRHLPRDEASTRPSGVCRTRADASRSPAGPGRGHALGMKFSNV